MNASLRALLSGVIDYAGLFPPARLPLDEAVRNYVRYRQEPDAWMLGRFVISAARRAELALPTDEPTKVSPLPLSVVAPERETFGGFRASSDRFTVDALELKGPFDPKTAAGAAEIVGLKTDLFWEFPLAEDWRSRVEALAAALRIYSASDPIRRVGLKLRTGGLEASGEQVAAVLRICRDAGVPLKFTAGLNHPIRRFDPGVQTSMHGFINVFVAGVLAHARGLDEEVLREVIAEENPGHFVFDDVGLSWKDVRASTAEIGVARRDLVTSFGSCSFDEPREDLHALDWL